MNTGFQKPHGVESFALSKRQVEFLGHISNGKLYKEAADAMGIANKTAANHAQAIVKKLGLNGPHCLLRFAYSGKCAVLLTNLGI